jgi:hypothetical protein
MTASPFPLPGSTVSVFMVTIAVEPPCVTPFDKVAFTDPLVTSS